MKTRISLIFLLFTFCFVSFSLYNYLDKKKEKIRTLENRIIDIEIQRENIAKKIGFIPFEYYTTDEVNILNKNYNLKKFKTNLLNFTKGLGGVGTSYLAYHNNDIFIITANGTIANTNIDSLNLQKFEMKVVNSNLNEILNERLMYKELAYGIKDAKIFQEKIYISFTDEIRSECFNISILEADISKQFLKFSYFFKPDECVKKAEESYFSLHQSGGRIVSFDNENLLVSIGEFRSRLLAQNKNSINGKIIKISIGSKNIDIISGGHRNPQGLFFDKKNKFIYSTEHGPKGGDEINIIKNLSNYKNFGWPISSYGEHYGYPEKNNSKLYKIAPLYKSHKDHGFVEPEIFFTPSIGISEIILINISNKQILITGSLGYDLTEGDMSLHIFLANNGKLIDHNILSLNERVRDLIFINEKNLILLFLESSTSIGLIKL